MYSYYPLNTGVVNRRNPTPYLRITTKLGTDLPRKDIDSHKGHIGPDHTSPSASSSSSFSSACRSSFRTDSSRSSAEALYSPLTSKTSSSRSSANLHTTGPSSQVFSATSSLDYINQSLHTHESREHKAWFEGQMAKAEQALCGLRTELMFYYQRKLTRGAIEQALRGVYEARGERHARAIAVYMTVGAGGGVDERSVPPTGRRPGLERVRGNVSGSGTDLVLRGAESRKGAGTQTEGKRPMTALLSLLDTKFKMCTATSTKEPIAITQSLHIARTRHRPRSPPPPRLAKTDPPPVPSVPPVPSLQPEPQQPRPPVVPPRPLNARKRNVTSPAVLGPVQIPVSVVNNTVRGRVADCQSPPPLMLEESQARRAVSTTARASPFSALREAFDRGGALISRRN